MTAISHALPAGRAVRVQPVVSARTRRLLCSLGVWAALALAVSIPVALIVFVTGDYRPMVVNTDAMAPTLEQGDVVVNEVVPPAEIQVGDIVTYVDSLRGDAAIIERVTEVTESAGRFSFTTQGDASTRAEHWSVDSVDTVGRVRFQSNIAGWFQSPLTGLPLAAVALGLPALLVLGALRYQRGGF